MFMYRTAAENFKYMLNLLWIFCIPYRHNYTYVLKYTQTPALIIAWIVIAIQFSALWSIHKPFCKNDKNELLKNYLQIFQLHLKIQIDD